jgi:hypothetical protein
MLLLCAHAVPDTGHAAAVRPCCAGHRGCCCCAPMLCRTPRMLLLCAQAVPAAHACMPHAHARVPHAYNSMLHLWHCAQSRPTPPSPPPLSACTPARAVLRRACQRAQRGAAGSRQRWPVLGGVDQHGEEPSAEGAGLPPGACAGGGAQADCPGQRRPQGPGTSPTARLHPHPRRRSSSGNHTSPGWTRQSHAGGSLWAALQLLPV